MTTAISETEEPNAGALALPTKRDEAWRYAPLKDLGQLSFGPSVVAAELSADVNGQIPVIDGPRIVLVNGVVDPTRSNLGSDQAGATIMTLADASDHNLDQVKAHFGAANPADVFVAQNIAFGSDGAFVQVADGHALDAPIHVVDIASPGEGQNTSCAGVVIHLGKDSAATVVETRIGSGQNFGGSNIRTTVTLADGAVLDHVILQDVPESQVHLSFVEVTQGAGSEFRARSFNLGGRYARFGYEIELAGEGARADLSGLYFGSGEQILDQQITVVHGAKDCTSRQSFRGVLADKSTGVFSGGIDVRPGADGTDAEQSNDNLLLSDRAEVNTQPRLEILADEVACVHGATVGQLDETALYYMRSRGIPADEARGLLINGFADQAVDEVKIQAVREWISERLGHEQSVGLEPTSQLHQEQTNA